MPGTAGLQPSIFFLTSYPELGSPVRVNGSPAGVAAVDLSLLHQKCECLSGPCSAPTLARLKAPPIRMFWPSTEISLQCNEGQQMPPDSRQVDVQQKHGEQNPTPARGATHQELGTAAGAGDVKLTEPKLLPDEQELRRIIDLIPQTIVVLNPDGKAIYANRVALDYTGLSLDEVRADNFRDRVFHPERTRSRGPGRTQARSGFRCRRRNSD